MSMGLMVVHHVFPWVSCFGIFGEPDSEALLARSEDRDGGVRRSAVKALEKAEPSRAKEKER